jgi:hypothetical protein
MTEAHAPLSAEEVRVLLRLYLDADFGPDEAERLRPLVQQQMDRLRALLALDLHDDAPDMAYIADPRLDR